MREQTGLDARAEQFGYVVAYLEGTGIYRRWGSDTPADIAFVSDLIQKIGLETPIDRGRVYAVGYSNGGRFAQRLACDPNVGIAALVSIAATLDSATASVCQPGRDVSALFVLGRDDPSIAWNATGRAGAPASLTVEETMGHWARLNGCSETPVVSESREETGVVRSEYDNCREDSKVIVLALPEQDHGWPAAIGGVPTSDLINEFFRSRPGTIR